MVLMVLLVMLATNAGTSNDNGEMVMVGDGQDGDGGTIGDKDGDNDW